MADFLMIFRPWRGGSRQMLGEDYVAAFSLPLLVILIGRQEALLFETPSSLMSLLCVCYTLYLIHTKNRWPRAPANSAVIALMASVIAVSITFIPGPRVNAWLTALVGFSCLNLYRYLLELVWREFRAAFTPGELLIITQAAAMATFSTLMELLKFTRLLKYHPILYTTADTTITTMSRTACVAAMFVFIVCLYDHSSFRTTLSAAILYSLCHVMLNMAANPATWIERFLTEEGRIYLVLYWFALLLLCLPVVFYYRVTSSDSTMTSSEETRAGSVSRKWFHVLILGVFVPGLCGDVPLLALAAGIAMAALIVVETIRLHSIPPLGPMVAELFSSFRDRQDRGRLLMTPMYLLCACAGPVWMSGGNARRGEIGTIPVWLGVMSVGVGDAAAAVVGTHLGKYTPKLTTGKSQAGFLACVVSQLLFWVAMMQYGVDGEHCVMPVVIFISSLAESFSSHVDNLIVPIYTLLSYTILEYVSLTFKSTDVT